MGKLYEKREFKTDSKYPLIDMGWSKRDLKIFDYVNKKNIFDQKNIEVPLNWTDQSAKIVASKYLYKGDGKDISRCCC